MKHFLSWRMIKNKVEKISINYSAFLVRAIFCTRSVLSNPAQALRYESTIGLIAMGFMF